MYLSKNPGHSVIFLYKKTKLYIQTCILLKYWNDRKSEKMLQYVLCDIFKMLLKVILKNKINCYFVSVVFLFFFCFLVHVLLAVKVAEDKT